MTAVDKSDLVRAGALLRRGDRVLLALGDLDKWLLTSSGICIPVTGIAGSRRANETMAERARLAFRETTGAEAELRHSRVTFLDIDGELTRETFPTPVAPILYQIRQPQPEIRIHVGVFLAESGAEPQPADVPGLLWAPLAAIDRLAQGVRYRDLRALHVELLANESIPDDAEFRLEVPGPEQLIPRIVGEFGPGAIAGVQSRGRCRKP